MSGQHEACVCGDLSPCGCGTPSPGWRPCPYRPLIWKDVPLLLASFREPLEKKLDQILRKVTKMAVSVDKLQSDVQALVDGGKAKDLLIKQLQDELANADASAQARVDAAVAAEDADAQAKIDAADAVAAEYLNPAPAGSGSGDVPADGGDVPPAA